MTSVKLTSKKLRTYGGFQWVVGEWAPPLSGEGGLCGPGYYHYYRSPLVAAMIFSRHGIAPGPIAFVPTAWTIEVRGKTEHDHDIKSGSTEMRIIGRVDLPIISLDQRVAAAILATLELSPPPAYRQWAEYWLSDEDRSAGASYEAWHGAPSRACREAAAAAHQTRMAARSSMIEAWAGSAIIAAQREAGGRLNLEHIIQRALENSEK